VEYLPPPSSDEPSPKPVAVSEPPPRRKSLGGLGAIGAAALALLLKFKLLLFFGLKLLGPFWLFLVSLWLYVTLFGWQFAIVIILLLLAHEFGHYFAFRAYGLPARLPILIPLLGAVTYGAVPEELEHDAYIALAGPLTGLALAVACYGAGIVTHDRFWFAVADTSAFLNLFNMIPIPPFDGGRIVGAIWPALWIGGFIIFLAASFYLHVPIWFILIIGVLGAPAMIAAFRGKVDPRAARMTSGSRVSVSIWYLATLFGLVYISAVSHAIASPHAAATGVAW
jgi:Zn-dependent protease